MYIIIPEITEAGKKLNLEELGINTDITKAQVVTKDEVVEQIDTVLHTDLLNETTRNQFIKDVNGLVQLPGDIIKAIRLTSALEDTNFLDNLVGVLRSTDAEMSNMLTMDKKYKELNKRTDLSPEERALEALKLANQSANARRAEFGIDNDVPITVLFADSSKGDELGAFYKEDGGILIFLDPSKIDMSDSSQVFNGIMYEMNHYNPSNPYVYDKKEGEVVKGSKEHELEETFTYLGRQEVTGESNNFYEEIIKGSKTLQAGNNLYDSIDEDMLDYGLISKIGEKAGKVWNKGSTLAGKAASKVVETGGKVAAKSVELSGKVVGKAVEVVNKDAGEIIKNKTAETSKKIVIVTNKTTKTVENKSKEIAAKVEGNIVAATEKLDETVDKVIVQPTKNVIQTTLENRKKYENVLILDIAVASVITEANPALKEDVEKGLEIANKYSLIEARTLEDPTKWSPWLAVAGSGLIQMPDGKAKAAGIALMVPQGIISAASAYNKGKSGDYEGAIQDGALSLSLFMLSGMAVQDSKGLLTQTTGKDSNKFFNKGDGIYTLENGTSQGLLSGNDFVRVNYVNGVATNAYGRLGGNTIMLDRSSVGAMSGTGLISSSVTNILGLPAPARVETLPDPYSNSGLLTYTPEVTRVNRVFISDPSGMTTEYQVGLNGLKPTYFPPTLGIVYNEHPYYGFYPATDISTLNNTSIFKEGVLPHILDVDVKVTINQQTGLPRDKVSGYHSNTITGIPTIDRSTIIVDPVTGVYKAKVINPISGTVKGGNQGYSTFFPDNWTAQQKVDAMNEAFNNKNIVRPDVYRGITKEGITIEMIIKGGEVITAYPTF